VAERNLREREGTLRAIVETAVDAIIVIDDHGSVRSFNGAAERMFGYAADEVVGQNVNLLMPSPFREEHDGYLRHFLDTGERRIIGIGRQVEGLRKDGSTFPVHLAVSEVDLGNRKLFAGILRDLSAG
jgi:PAS domain S-box-containing protein